VEHQEHRKQTSTMDHLIRSSDSIDWLEDKEVTDLKKLLKKEEIPIWEILLLDSKDYLLRRDYREAIYAINGAFENYLMLKAREKLISKWTEKDVNEYLDGKPVYKYHKMKKYMDEATFNKAIKEDIITSYIPSTYQI